MLELAHRSRYFRVPAGMYGYCGSASSELMLEECVSAVKTLSSSDVEFEGEDLERVPDLFVPFELLESDTARELLTEDSSPAVAWMKFRTAGSFSFGTVSCSRRPHFCFVSVL